MLSLKKARTLTMLLLVTSAISGCARSERVPMQLGEGCASFFLFKPSRADTESTKQQILAHNTTYREKCPEGRP